MKLMHKFSLLTLLVLIGFTSCKKDDGPELPQLRDRGQEAVVAIEEIEAFLETHFYNYEEFANPPAGFDYKIKIDTIAGDNAGKIPLMQQVSHKIVTDRIQTHISYKFYYLTAVQGDGESPIFADTILASYEGKLLDRTPFDASDAPIAFDLTRVIVGFHEGLTEFNAATGFTENPDGTVNFENFGVGAIFIPSGLAYFGAPPQGVNVPRYAQLIFTFRLYDVTKNVDHDKDGIPSFMEDLNQNGNLFDVDTDRDGIPNFMDEDDDGDGVLTRDEIIIHADGTIEFPDSNGNGIPDYLDKTYPYN